MNIIPVEKQTQSGIGLERNLFENTLREDDRVRKTGQDDDEVLAREFLFRELVEEPGLHNQRRVSRNEPVELINRHNDWNCLVIECAFLESFRDVRGEQKLFLSVMCLGSRGVPEAGVAFVRPFDWPEQARKRLIRKLWFYPNNVATRNRKNFLSVTPLTSARKPFSLALNDSAAALVLRLIK